MTVINQIKNGIKKATASINLLALYPACGIYLAIPAFIAIFLYSLIYNIRMPYDQLNITSALNLGPLLSAWDAGPSWIHLIWSSLVQYIYTFGLTCALIALSLHTFKIIHTKKASYHTIIQETLSRLPQITLWALIETTRNIFFKSILSSSLAFLTTGLWIIWILATFFVIPLLSLNNLSVKEALISSLMMIQEKFVLIVSGLSWLAFLTFLITIPIILLGFFIGTTNPLLAILFVTFFIVLKYSLWSIYIIFATISTQK